MNDAMDPKVLAQRALAGIEAGKLEIRPGVANVLKIMSRVAPGFMLKQMTKLSKDDVLKLVNLGPIQLRLTTQNYPTLRFFLPAPSLPLYGFLLS
jgi:hypothetical protein